MVAVRSVKTHGDAYHRAIMNPPGGGDPAGRVVSFEDGVWIYCVGCGASVKASQAESHPARPSEDIQGSRHQVALKHVSLLDRTCLKASTLRSGFDVESFHSQIEAGLKH